MNAEGLVIVGVGVLAFLSRSRTARQMSDWSDRLRPRRVQGMENAATERFLVAISIAFVIAGTAMLFS